MSQSGFLYSKTNVAITAITSSVEIITISLEQGQCVSLLAQISGPDYFSENHNGSIQDPT